MRKPSTEIWLQRLVFDEEDVVACAKWIMRRAKAVIADREQSENFKN
jgi:hypothetical protein